MREGQGMDLEQFARQVKPKGEKMISADTVSRLNDKYFGQWMALHVPFTDLQDLNDAEVREKVPERYYYFACALRRRPDYWRDHEKIKADMMVEADGDEHIANVLNMVQAHTHIVEEYLSGRLSKTDEEKSPMSKSARKKEVQAQAPTATIEWKGRQKRLKDNIDKRVDQALEIRNGRNEDEVEAARQRVDEHGGVSVAGPILFQIHARGNSNFNQTSDPYGMLVS